LWSKKRGGVVAPKEAGRTEKNGKGGVLSTFTRRGGRLAHVRGRTQSKKHDKKRKNARGKLAKSKKPPLYSHDKIE